jgi:hypothetical protein
MRLSLRRQYASDASELVSMRRGILSAGHKQMAIFGPLQHRTESARRVEARLDMPMAAVELRIST